MKRIKALFLVAMLLVASAVGAAVFPSPCSATNPTNCSRGTWGQELRDFFTGTFDLLTGKLITPYTDTVNVEKYASLAAAVTDIGSATKTLLIPSNQACSTAITTPTTLTVEFTGSGKITKSTGCTLTFNGPFEAPLKQVFSGFAAGDVTFGAGSVDRLYFEWGGARADNSTDSTTAVLFVVGTAKNSVNVPIRALSGQYKLTGEVIIPQGVLIECAGSGGNTQQYGTTFVHYSNGNLFVWDGTGTAFAGTGGGLKDCLILKADTFSGGDAIKALATSDGNRPGEMFFENVVIYGIGTGLWERGLHIDGTAVTTAGSKGVRSVFLNKFRVADCTTSNQYIYINQGVHVTGTHVQIDQADGSGTPGLTIAGDSENVNLSNFIINGNVVVADNATHVNLHGRVSTLNVAGTSVIGTANLSVTSQILNASKTFKIAASNLKPAFLGVRTTAAADVTGDNTNYTVVFDSETFDKGGDFNPATGKFTANVAGVYKFQAMVLFSDLASGHTRADVVLNHKDSGSSTVGSYAAILNPFAISASGNAAVPISVEVEMSKGDTMEFVVNVSGSTKVVNVFGTAATIYTFFGGTLQ